MSESNQGRGSAWAEAAQDLELNAYCDVDDGVTELFEPPSEGPKWIVQVTPLDRRLLSTAELLAELEAGGRLHARTLVWNRGMPDWRVLAEVEELWAAAAAALGERVSGVRARVGAPVPLAHGTALSPAHTVWAATLAALITTSVTTYALYASGAFGAGGSGVTPGLLD